MTPEELKTYYEKLEPQDTTLSKLRRKINETALGVELDCIPTDTISEDDPMTPGRARSQDTESDPVNDDISVLHEIARGRTQPGDNITQDEAREFLHRLTVRRFDDAWIKDPDTCRECGHSIAKAIQDGYGQYAVYTEGFGICARCTEHDAQAEAHHSCDPGPRERCWHTSNKTEGHEICPCDCHDEHDNPPDYTIHSTV